MDRIPVQCRESSRFSDVNIRLMRNNDRLTVRSIVRRTFSPIEQYFFAWTPYVLVVEGDGQLLGAIVLKIFALPHHRKGGAIAWLATVPEVRGWGLGQSLVEAGLDFLENQGCNEILASVEGFNTSSSKLFATRGFAILSPIAQFRRYGLATFAVWGRISHYSEQGYFLWVRPAPVESDSPLLQWWGTIAMNVTLLLGKPLILFDIAMPFFPFICFNGRRLWDWNKTAWGLMAAAAIIVCLV